MDADPLFPPAEPYRTGHLEVSGGHRIYFEECGRADGVPVLFLHGGPGSGCNAAQRRLFDPRRYRAVLTDQRGCGRSLPLGGLDDNTTGRLVADLEALRGALGIPAWIVFGGSWGSALALAYAQAHPRSVRALLLRGIFLASREEVAAYLESGVPAARDRLEAAAGAGEGGLLAALAARVPTADEAARAWLDYERAFMDEPPIDGPLTPAQRAKARIQLHYLARDCFIEAGSLLAGVDRIRHVPAAIVQGLADPVCPPQHAERLRRAWPEARWLPVPGGAHGGLTPPIAAACMAALGALADEVAGQNP